MFILLFLMLCSTIYFYIFWLLLPLQQIEQNYCQSELKLLNLFVHKISVPLLELLNFLLIRNIKPHNLLITFLCCIPYSFQSFLIAIRLIHEVIKGENTQVNQIPGPFKRK